MPEQVDLYNPLEVTQPFIQEAGFQRVSCEDVTGTSS